MSKLDEFILRHDESCWCEMAKDYRPEKCTCGQREAAAELKKLYAENKELARAAAEAMVRADAVNVKLRMGSTPRPEPCPPDRWPK